MSTAIKIYLYATFKLIAGQKEYELPIREQTTVHEAILLFLESAPVLKLHWLNQQGELHAHVLIFLNGTDISTLPLNLETEVHDGDTLEFIPPVAGG